MSPRRLKFLIFVAIAGIGAAAAAVYAGRDQEIQNLPSFLPQSAVVTGGIVIEDDQAPVTATQPAQQPASPTSPPDTPPTAMPGTTAPDASSPAAPPPVQNVEDITRQLNALTAQIEKLEKAVSEKARDDAYLARVRPAIDDIVAKANAKTDRLKPRLKDIENQITKLGPEPKEGEPAETDQVKEERKRIDDKKTEIAGALKTAELVTERARQLAGKAQDLRQRIFTDAILAQGRSPLAPSLWIDVARELPAAGGQLSSLFTQWFEVLARTPVQALGVLLFALLSFEILRRLMIAARRRQLAGLGGEQKISFFARVLAAGWVMGSFALPGIAASIIFYYGLDSFGLMSIFIARLGRTVLLATVVILIVWALSRAILQPNRPGWRLVDVPDQAAHRLTLIFTLMAGVYGADLVMQHLMQQLYLPLPVRVAEAAFITLASAALLFAFVRTPLTQPATVAAGMAPSYLPPQPGAPDAPAAPSIMVPRWLKWPSLALAVAMTGTALLGYVALGRFVAGQVTVTGSLIVAGILFWLAIRALTQNKGDLSERPLELALRKHLHFGQTQARLLTGAAAFLLQIALPFAAVPVLFWSWGYSFADAIAWLKSLFFGFQVGQFRISVVELLVAAGLFVALLFLTRVLQRWINARLTQPGRINNGIANSIQTGIGYLGFALATLAALSYAGFDITNLAIVAGALSIGIGFGLQSIVNNFVSGLIILFERPIKVGDWVSVGAYEGHVRKISVRSTEIETFDRTNVIVPNSEFISNPIVNLTHRNALGRVVIGVGVSYKSDPETVRDLLLKVAKECPDILENPSPSVAFEEFGASSLDFKVRAYIADVNTRLSVATELRIRIFKALAEAGIEIPFPQHDIHLRDLDPVRASLERAALKTAARAGGGDEGTGPT